MTERKGQGSLKAGIILLGLGVFFLLRDLGFFRFAHFWPLVLIGIGVYLLVRYSSGRSSSS